MSAAAIARLPAPEVASRLAAGAAVLLPMGSTETHGPAAPMGDYLIAEAIALEIAEAAHAAGDDALVAPPIPFGGDDFFRGIPGGVALSTPTLTALVVETLEALLRGGASRILVVNGHGGNIPSIEDAQRHLRRTHDAVVPVLHLWRAGTAALPALGADPRATGHGGDPVLSVALHLFPELCHPERLAPREAPGRIFGLPVSGFGTIRAGGAEIGVPVEIPEIAPGGVAAEDPRGANEALGARIVAHLVGAGAALLAAMKGNRAG